jgi:hypothetical protein
MPALNKFTRLLIYNYLDPLSLLKTKSLSKSEAESVKTSRILSSKKLTVKLGWPFKMLIGALYWFKPDRP